MVIAIFNLLLVSFESSVVKFNIFNTVKKVHSFKVFKKSTKFKKYNNSITRFIMNRKKYLIKKKTTTFINKFFVPLLWSSYFSKKKQLVRFYQFYYMLDYMITLASNALILRSYDLLFSTSNKMLIDKFYLNSTFLSKQILVNNTLFNPLTPKSTINFYKNTKFGFLLTNDFTTVINILPGGGIFYDNSFINIRPTNSISDPFKFLQKHVLLNLISVVKSIRKLIINLILLKIISSVFF